MDLLLAAEQQSVTDWPQRLLLTALVVIVTLLAIWGMWRSWHTRAAVELPLDSPPDGFEADTEIIGRYLGTAPEADWMQRVVASGMGAPGNAIANLSDPGVLLTREGEPDLFIGAEQIDAVEIGRGVAGQVAEKDGIVIWHWRAGDAALQSGFRPDAPEDVARLARVSQRFVGEEN
jgi:hypothetical protein